MLTKDRFVFVRASYTDTNPAKWMPKLSPAPIKIFFVTETNSCWTTLSLSSSNITSGLNGPAPCAVGSEPPITRVTRSSESWHMTSWNINSPWGRGNWKGRKSIQSRTSPRTRLLNSLITCRDSPRNLVPLPSNKIGNWSRKMPEIVPEIRTMLLFLIAFLENWLNWDKTHATAGA